MEVLHSLKQLYYRAEYAAIDVYSELKGMFVEFYSKFDFYDLSFRSSWLEHPEFIPNFITNLNWSKDMGMLFYAWCCFSLMIIARGRSEVVTYQGKALFLILTIFFYSLSGTAFWGDVVPLFDLPFYEELFSWLGLPYVRERQLSVEINS